MFEEKKKKILVWYLFPLLLLIVILGILFAQRPKKTAMQETEPPVLTEWVDRGLSQEMAQDYEKRIGELEQLLQTDEQAAKDISQILILGNLKYGYGDLVGAKETYEKILSTHPADAPAHENLGQTLQEMGDYKGAEQHWIAAIASSPYVPTYLKLADLWDTHFPEKHVQIQSLLEDAIATLGQNPNLLIRLGNWYQQEGDYERAISHYEVAFKIDPTNIGLQTLIEETRNEAQKAK